MGHSSDCSCSSSSNCCYNAAILPDRSADPVEYRTVGRSCSLKSCCFYCNCFHIELLQLLLLLLLYHLNLTCLFYYYYCSLMLAVHHYGISVVYDNIT